MKKTIKHCELLEQRHKCPSIKRVKMKMFSSVNETDENNRSVTRSKFVDYDPAESLKYLRVEDFSIQALTSVGADLHVTSFTKDNHAFVDDMKRELSKFDNILSKTE